MHNAISMPKPARCLQGSMRVRWLIALSLLSTLTSGCGAGAGAVYPDAASGSPWVRPDELPGARARAKRRGPQRRSDFGVLLAPRFGFESVKVGGRERFGGVAMALEGEAHFPVARYLSIGGGVGWQVTMGSEESASSEGKAAFRLARGTALAYGQFAPAYPLLLRVGIGGAFFGQARLDDEDFHYDGGSIITAGAGFTYPCASWEGDCLVLVEWRRTWGGMTTPERTTESFYSDALVGTAALVVW